MKVAEFKNLTHINPYEPRLTPLIDDRPDLCLAGLADCRENLCGYPVGELVSFGLL